MSVFLLNQDIIFPPPLLAEPDGLLAVGGDLSVPRLLTAYQSGIFPWYSAEEPILWWSPAPRLVLFPEEFHLAKRLARTMRRHPYTVTANTAFRQVIELCGKVREQKEGTWITAAMKEAYCDLHDAGYANSVECWENDILVGGLYGVFLGKVFFGESMFTIRRDASKIALATLVQKSDDFGIRLIDCQMKTPHLLRFGAREISGSEFQLLLKEYIPAVMPAAKWAM